MQTKVCKKCNEELPATIEYFHKSKNHKHGLRNVCKKCRRKIRQEGYNKEYYKNNKVNILKYQEEYRKTNKEKLQMYFRQHGKTDKRKKSYIIKTHKQRAFKKYLQATFTIENWEICKTYFNNKCAYCGKETELQQEHFIPLSKNGEYTKNNIIPTCAFCNNSKHSKDFFEWYLKQQFYSKERENKILSYLALR